MPSPYHREDPANDEDKVAKILERGISSALSTMGKAWGAVAGKSELSAASGAKNIRRRKRRNREALEKSK